MDVTTNSTKIEKRGIKIRNWKTNQRAKGEINTLPSMTVPDMSLDLRTLIERHTRGQQIPIMQGEYEYDEHGKLKSEIDLPQIENLSLVEKLQIAADHRANVKEAKKTVIENKIAAKKLEEQTKSEAEPLQEPLS